MAWWEKEMEERERRGGEREGRSEEHPYHWSPHKTAVSGQRRELYRWSFLSSTPPQQMSLRKQKTNRQ